MKPNHLKSGLRTEDVKRDSSLAYRKPKLFVIGRTNGVLKGHHGSGQESGGYAPKP